MEKIPKSKSHEKSMTDMINEEIANAPAESQFEVVKRHEDGTVARMEKIGIDTDLKYTGEFDLPPEQRKGLRTMLDNLGIPLRDLDSTELQDEEGGGEEPQKKTKKLGTDEEIDTSRRIFLKKAAVGTAAGIAAAAGIKVLTTDSEEDVFETPEVHEVAELEEAESIEEVEDLATFENEMAGYKALVLLAHDEIQFVDEYNRPVGEPQKYEDFTIKIKASPDTPPDQILPDGTVFHNLTPSKIMHKLGFPEEGISGKWLDHVRDEVQADYPGQKIVNTLHVDLDFLAALSEKDEPELVKGINNGEIVRYIDIIKYFADKPVVGAEKYTRQEYVRDGEGEEEEKNIKFTDRVPLLIREELRRLIPGLCAQESKFNNGLISPAGAKGIFQFKPDTWKDYNDDPNEQRSLIAQAKAAGEHFSDLYKWIQTESLVGEGTIDVLRSRFSNEDDFNMELLVPLIVNAHNTGIGTMTGVIKTYVEKTAVEDMPEGRELFLAIANFGKQGEENTYLSNYVSESREYVTRVYAQAEVLDSIDN